MHKLFRIHGDNIVECERVISYITQNADVIHSLSKAFSSFSCLSADIDFDYKRCRNNWTIEMFPGFTNNRQRWQANIFDALKDNGSFLDEAPDAIVTRFENGRETILFAIEFCSALQAGNQAWQRSGRAYSVGRTGCPYIYIVDFAKYELDPETRKRKSLRFPNPAVPYSYISFSKRTANFVAQAYIKAEEFQQTEEIFESFQERWFSEKLIGDFIIQKMLGASTTQTEIKIIQNNFSIVSFLAPTEEDKNSFSKLDWQTIFDTGANFLDYSKNRPDSFSFGKTITRKSQPEGSKIGQLAAAIKELSVGIAKKDLPFGILPSNRVIDFINKLKELYPEIASSFDVLNSIGEDYIVCMVKGFKPGGDDNRPDRGILPMIAMLASEKAYIISCIYGPIIENNYRLLISDPIQLSNNNGFWQVFLSLSDFLLLDAPLLNTSQIINEFIDNRRIKQKFITQNNAGGFSLAAIPNVAAHYCEDDVDTVLHFLFSYMLADHAFEGFCNPPGGDWSGLSLRLDNHEYRWLSLRRVTTAKRPDHIAELFIPNHKPILIIIESKERANNLELDIGEKLRSYIHWLMGFPPSVTRTDNDAWHPEENIIGIDRFEILTAIAYLNEERNDDQQILQESKCDLLFILTPNVEQEFWQIEILANTESIIANEIRQNLIQLLAKGDNNIFIAIQKAKT